MAYSKSEGSYLIKSGKDFSPKVAENPLLDEKFAKIDEFVDSFDDYLVGFAVLFAGVSKENAKAAGV